MVKRAASDDGQSFDKAIPPVCAAPSGS